MQTFSLESYRQLLLTFRSAGYSFCRFEDINQRLVEKQPFVVLRHDIDISLRPALEVAYVEYEQAIQATYFITLHSPFYNALTCSSEEILLQLHRLGHDVALHAELTVYDGDCARALSEIDVLAKFYPYLQVQIASLHSPRNLEQIPIQAFEQLRNVYGHVFSKDVAYISDSTGRWRYGHPLDSEAFHSGKPIQLLTHPIWWVQDGEMATEKLRCWLYKDYLHNLMAAEQFMPKLFSSVRSNALLNGVR